MTKSDTLDSFDRKLLEILQEDCQRAVSVIAESVGLSLPACYRRIRRLRATGIIEREIAIVQPRTLGWPLSMIILVKLERDGTRTIEQMTQKFQAEPEVAEAWHITGDFDLAVRIVARDMEGFDELAERLFSTDDLVRNFKTLVVIREMKTFSPVPV